MNTFKQMNDLGMVAGQKPKRHQSDVIQTGPLGFSSDRGALFKGNKMDDTFPPTASVFEE